MGIFDFFRRKKDKQTSHVDKSIESIRKKQKLLDLYSEIEQNKYINDEKAKQLYENAYKETADNLIERHFYYNNVIDYFYGLRNKDKNAREK